MINKNFIYNIKLYLFVIDIFTNKNLKWKSKYAFLHDG